MKINTKKFIRNILICVVAWLVVSFILNYSPGFKRDKYVGVTNLVINDEDVTENLKQNVYVSENKKIYLSLEDVKNIFDKNIYFDDTLNLVITTSNTKVASFNLESNKIVINGVEQVLDSAAFKQNDVVYIPLSELSLVYNIETKYIENTDIAVIEILNDGLIKAQVTEKATIKYKPRFISKKIGQVNVGDELSCYYTTSKGWRLIRTEDGILGYVKANVLDNEYIVRQDYDDEIKTTEIVTSTKDGTVLTLYNNENPTKVIIKTLFNLKENGILGINDDLKEEDYTVWATFSNKGIEKYSNEMIKDYSKRTDLINTILSLASKNKIKGINIDFNNISDQEAFCRFIIELTPRLRELGVTTNIILNNSINFEDKLVGIVDFFIKEQ